MKTKLPHTTTADAEKEKRLKMVLQRLTNDHAPLETIIRVKTLIAYYKGIPVDVIATCYDVTTKSVKKLRG